MEQIIKFKNRNKFSDESWEKRGLNPSSSDFNFLMNRYFNEISEAVIDILNNGSKKDLKNFFKNELSGLKSSQFDTEEREFVADLFDELATYADINLKKDLNIWLYGRIMTLLRNLFKK